MLNNLETSTKESLFFKIPTLLADILVQVLTLQWLLYGTTMVREKNLLIYEKPGTTVLLIASCLLSFLILRNRLDERHRSTLNVGVRAFMHAFFIWGLFNGLMAVIYELTLQGKLLVLQLAITSVAMVSIHLIFRLIINHLRRSGANTYAILMVGTAENILSVYKSLLAEKEEKGYNFLGFFTDHPERVPEGATFLGTVEESFSYIDDNHEVIKELFCSLNPATDPARVNQLVAHCEKTLVRFTYVPDMKGYPKRKLTFLQVGNVNVISLYDEPLNQPWAKIVKRIFDIVLSALFLLTLFPFIWLFCAIGIKLSSPRGGVFFRQKRTGYEGKEFWCLKFRSMHPSADADTKQAVKGDSRVFPFGEFLRKSSLDELPQFINVLKGDMSIIGPRPHMVYHTDVYSDLIGDYMVRHYAKPGITGWAQIKGCRGETKELSEMKERIEKDIYYIEHWSVEMDIYIFLKTIWQLLRHEDEKAY